MEDDKIFKFKDFQITCKQTNNYKKIVEDIFSTNLKKHIKTNCKSTKKAAS